MPDPVYDFSHPHPLTAITGYDVVRTRWAGQTVGVGVTVTVTDVVDGASNAATAQQLARAHRAGGRYQWGYAAPRYACGCRWLGTLGAGTTIIDLELTGDPR